MLYLPCPTIHQHFSSSYTLPTATEVTSHPKGPQKIANMDNNFLMPNKLPERATGNQSPSPGRRLGNRIKKIFRPNSHTAPPPAYEQVIGGAYNHLPVAGPSTAQNEPSDPKKEPAADFCPSSVKVPSIVQNEPSDSKKELAVELSPPSREKPPTIQSEPLAPKEEQMTAENLEGILAHKDILHFLKYLDVVIIVDDSGSMRNRDFPPDPTRWDEAKTAVASLAPECVQRDSDGIEIRFLNNRSNDAKGLDSEEKVMERFNFTPQGGTPLREVLHKYLHVEYLPKLGGQVYVKPVIILVVTDGEPTGPNGEIKGAQEAVKTCLADAIKKLRSKKGIKQFQLGIQFFQVGQNEASTRFLRDLDNNLAESEGIPEDWDLIDTCTFDESVIDKMKRNVPFLTREGMCKALRGTIDKRWDQMRMGVR